MKNISFEQSLERLEEVVKLLESGSAPLDESMRLYEEGIALVRKCTDELDKTEAKIKILQTRADGSVTAADFDGTATDA